MRGIEQMSVVFGTSDWRQHHGKAKQLVSIVLSSPALDTHIVEKHNGSSSRAVVLAVEQLQRGRGHSWEYHIAQQKRDVCDAESENP